jgi:hypothetical protein
VVTGGSSSGTQPWRGKRRQAILPGAVDAWALRGEEAARQVGRPHEFGLEINDKKLLPSDMNGCKFPTTYRQEEEPRKNMIAREGERARKKFCASCLSLTSVLWM